MYLGSGLVLRGYTFSLSRNQFLGEIHSSIAQILLSSEELQKD